MYAFSPNLLVSNFESKYKLISRMESDRAHAHRFGMFLPTLNQVFYISCFKDNDGGQKDEDIFNVPGVVFHRFNDGVILGFEALKAKPDKVLPSKLSWYGDGPPSMTIYLADRIGTLTIVLSRLQMVIC